MQYSLRGRVKIHGGAAPSITPRRLAAAPLATTTTRTTGTTISGFVAPGLKLFAGLEFFSFRRKKACLF